eukprot:893301-Alexandrium_andersonii.AAC.1
MSASLVGSEMCIRDSDNSSEIVSADLDEPCTCIRFDGGAATRKTRGVGGAGAVIWSVERGVWHRIGTASRRVENCTDAQQAELAAV